MNISQASEACGLPDKTIRYYEEVGLIVPKRQKGNGYRVYSIHEIAQLRFLQQARIAGFSLAECKELLRLYSDPAAYTTDWSRQLVNQKVAHIDQQLAALHILRETLLSIGSVNDGEVAMSEQQAGNVQESSSSSLGMAFRLVGEPKEHG